jgi:hypothetical protein
MAMTKPKTSKRKMAEQKATSPKHSDAAQDKKLIAKMMKKGCK